MNIKFFKSKKMIVLYCLFGCFLLLFFLSQIPPVSEYFFARGVSRGLSFLISRISYILPFSAFEWLVLLLIPALIATLIIFRKQIKKVLYILLLIILSVGIFYVSTYGALYNRESSFSHLDVKAAKVTKESLGKSIDYYLDNTLAAEANLTRDDIGNIINPHSFSELSKQINSEYKTLNDSYFYGYTVKPKKVVNSSIMSYLRISGIYFPFSGEANINTQTSTFDLPVVMAHEIAHAKGVAHENEANFIAYYLCMNSNDEYLSYSGNLRATLSLLSALKNTDNELYKAYRQKLPETINIELENDYADYVKYESFLGDVSNFFNDLFLKANGVPDGTISYSKTTEYLIDIAQKKSNA